MGTKGGRGFEGGGRGRLYTYHYTVTMGMTWWAAMRAILMFHNCEGQSQRTVSTDHQRMPPVTYIPYISGTLSNTGEGV